MQTRSRRQREILDFIVEFVESEGYEPSYRQIASHCGLSSKGGIARHIAELEKKGLLKRNREAGAFSLEVFPSKTVNDHICEVEWIEGAVGGNGKDEADGPLLVPKSLLGYLPPKKVRGMVVPDNAMAGEHILEGDIALIERKSFARDGDRVAVRIDGKRVVLGSFYRKGAAIELRPSNENYEPVRVQADKATILGLYRGLLRKI
jgi:repressor LexA